MNSKLPLLLAERQKFHAGLLSSVITVAGGIPSIADKDNRLSVDLSTALLSIIGTCREMARSSGQRSGNTFENACASYLTATFNSLNHLRPGSWSIRKVTRGGGGISSFDQYLHLKHLSKLCKADQTVATALGLDYLICPDIVILRKPEPDETINQASWLINESVAKLTPIREINSKCPILHASISCKFTIRSDRAQNARSEALNLIKNRKGQTPHIVVVTAEPLPSRLASLAMGTGEIDCIYHFALPELSSAVDEKGHDDSKELLRIMIEGKRLRDIADLPLDLAI